MVNQHSSKLATIATVGSTSVARRESPRKFNFTKKLLDRVPLPENGQRAYVYDSATRGLALAVSPAGKKVFVLYRKVAGRPERITIGPYPDLSIEQARDRAAELNGAIARGENPSAKLRKVRDEMTLDEMFKAYLEHYAKVHKKTWANDQSIFDAHLNAWRVRKMSEIRKMDVTTLHSRIGSKSGKYAANRVVELLSSMFNWAIRDQDWEGENPAAKVKAFRERKRERFLQPEELPAFFKALGAELNETVRDYIFLSLLTGARRANVQAMRWEQINWATSTWKIPETKNGESVTVALSVPAISVLENRKASSASEWVFPGRGSSGHLIEPKSAWKRILESAAKIQRKDWLEANPKKTDADYEKENPGAGFRDLRIHDLRRTLGSWQAATGASLPIIGKSLGHKSVTATQIYARLNLDPVRASVNKATDAMLLAAKRPLLESGRG
jgi:integrase